MLARAKLLAAQAGSALSKIARSIPARRRPPPTVTSPDLHPPPAPPPPPNQLVIHTRPQQRRLAAASLAAREALQRAVDAASASATAAAQTVLRPLPSRSELASAIRTGVDGARHIASAPAAAASRTARNTALFVAAVLIAVAFAYGAGSAAPHAWAKYQVDIERQRRAFGDVLDSGGERSPPPPKRGPATELR